MLKEFYVVNEAVSSCCGHPAGRCSCGEHHARADQSEFLGSPSWEFANPLSEMSDVSEMAVNNIGVALNPEDPGQQDLLGQPIWNFANPLDKAKPASVGNRSQVRDEDEIVGELPWHFANPLR